MPKKRLKIRDSNLGKTEWKILARLSTPGRIQDYLNRLHFNFKDGEYISPERVIREKKADCFEGALLAAAALWIQGHEPLLLDLKVSDKSDYDHVVALFKKDGYWGAISKTNHIVLRYREPVYKSPRELVMSYFHEYFLSSGKKTLRSYSKPFDLSKLGTDWITKDPSWIAERLDKSPHIKILTDKQVRGLRKAEKIEIRAGRITEWTRK
jgi:hypothetical protein